MIEKEFIPYKQALALKELGFDEKCFATYRTNAVGSKKPFEHDLDYHTKVEMSSNVIPINSEYTEESKWISAPLYQQAFRWFREKCDLIGVILPYLIIGNQWYYKVTNRNNNLDLPFEEVFETYEEAELDCLNKLIEITKTK